MPTYSIQGPDGKTYSIDGPEGATRDQVIAKIKERQGTQPEEGSTWTGAAKQFGIGIPAGAEEFLETAPQMVLGGMAGEGGLQAARNIGSYLPDWQKKLGISREEGQPNAPKGTGEAVARSAGEFIGNPASWIGPEGWGVKALAALFGGAGSELLGEAGGSMFGRPGETVGRILGGAAGGGAIGAAERGSRLNLPPTNAAGGGLWPLLDEAGIKAASNKNYQNIRNNPVQMMPDENVNLFREIKKNLAAIDADDINSPITHRRAEEVLPSANVTRATRGNPSRVNYGATRNSTDILSIHNKLSALASDTFQTDPAEARAALNAKDTVRNWLLANLPKKASKGLLKAIGDWAAQEKISDVRMSLQIALNRAHVSGSNKNAINTMRQEIRKIIDNDKRSRGYSQRAERKAQQIIEGSRLENISRAVGKSLPYSSGFAILESLREGHINIPLVGFAGITYTARQLGDFLTRRQIEQLIQIFQEEAPANQWYAARNRAIRARTPQTGVIGAARGAAVGEEQPPGTPPDNPDRVAMADNDENAQAPELKPPPSAKSWLKIDNPELYEYLKKTGQLPPEPQKKSAVDPRAAYAQLAHSMRESPLQSAGDLAVGAAGGIPWTGPEIGILRAGLKAGEDVEKIALKLPGRTREAIYEFSRRIMPQLRKPRPRALERGLTVRAHPNWTTNEIQFVYDRPEWDAGDIAKAMQAQGVNVDYRGVNRIRAWLTTRKGTPPSLPYSSPKKILDQPSGIDLE